MPSVMRCDGPLEGQCFGVRGHHGEHAGETGPVGQGEVNWQVTSKR